VIAVDSSIVVAGFASWHESHSLAVKVLDRSPRLIAHAAVEAFSVLTRLPPPHRAQPQIVHDFLTIRFTEPVLTLSDVGYLELLATAATSGLAGGQTYDALIGFTAAEHEATLISLDRRAAVTYEAVGATTEPIEAN
jgi:predicted nucleic acid-binding protein